MLNTKIRKTIIASTAVAALSIPGAASAAAPVHSPGTVTPGVVAQPTTVAKEAGGQGTSIGDAIKKCEALRATLAVLENMKTLAANTGNIQGVQTLFQGVTTVQESLAKNCPEA
jgi:hypothetical protein